jgi:UDP-glucose 4-epimerase
MRALVLGGCGFIGSHVVDGLLAAGHSVRVYDRAPELFRVPLSGVDYSYGDFTDVPLLVEALEGVDVVYHLISTTVPSTSNLDPVADVQGNLINTLRLLHLLIQKRINKIVFLSSGGTVYGVPEAIPMLETHPLRPICSYGVVKVAIENYLQMFYHLHGLRYVVLRVSNPYGERQGHAGVQGVIGTYMRNVLADEPIEIWGDGKVVRDFIFVGDLAKLCVQVGESHESGIFNAGSGVGHSINEIVSILMEVSDKKIVPIYKPGRGYDVPRVVLDVNLAFLRFGWRPNMALKDGIGLVWKRVVR